MTILTTLMKKSPATLGILSVVVAVSLFSIQDVSIKWLSGDYPLHEIVFIRAVVAIALTLAILVPLDGGFRALASPRIGLHLLRGGAIVVGNMAFFTSLASLPLPEAVAIFFTAPLMITLLAVPVLKERIGPRRLGAVIVGFIGALVIIQPGAGSFRVAAILPLIAAFAYSSMQMMTRMLGTAEKASTMAFYIQLMFVSASAGMWLVAGDGRFAGGSDPSWDFLFREWVWPNAFDFWLIVAIGCINAFAGYLIGQGYRLAEAGLLAPFEYVAVPLSVLWGVMIWGEWPDVYVWLGIAMICGAGIYVALREGRAPQRR